MKYTLAFVAWFCPVLAALGAPPDVPSELKVKPGQVVAITVKTQKKLGLSKNFSPTDAFFGELVAPAGQKQFMFQAPLPGSDGKYTGKPQFVISWWTEGELEGVCTTILIEGAQAPIPPPTPPTPEPIPPAPVSVTSFHSILVYDPGQLLTPEQSSLLTGSTVENALKAACNLPGASAWRRLSNKADPATLPAGLKEVWTAAKPLVGNGTPCIVFQVNEKITLEPFNKPDGKIMTPEEMSAMIASYRGGKQRGRLLQKRRTDHRREPGDLSHYQPAWREVWVCAA